MSQAQLSFLPSTIDASQNSTSDTLKILQDAGTDYEWFPTTDKMIQAVISDASNASASYECNKVLDIGAGDGRVLQAFHESKSLSVQLHGIEKSPEHVARWDDITFIGGDFYETTLANQPMDLVFSNPPYAEFERWSEYLILNVNASVTYLILPKRWIKSERIQVALNKRNLIATVILSDDFLLADRRARAKVDILRITNKKFKDAPVGEYNPYHHWEEGSFRFNATDDEDPLFRAFREAFPNIPTADEMKHETSETVNTYLNEIVTAKTPIEAMVEFYQKDLDNIMQNYKALNNLDRKLFGELGINVESIQKTLSVRMKSLKNEYWLAFIENYNPITRRLMSKYQTMIYSNIIDQFKHVDFTVTNALIVTTLVIEHAQKYNDVQVKDYYLNLANRKGMRLYKSNQKLFEDERWRYTQRSQMYDNLKFHLDYRIVDHNAFNVHTNWKGELEHDDIRTVVDDIDVLARIVGMPGFDYSRLEKGTYFEPYLPGESCIARYYTEGKAVELFKIKFYKNGNQHLYLNSEFALRLNIYIGKLLGWLKSSEEAYSEMDIKSKKMKQEAFDDIYNSISTNSQLEADKNSVITGLLGHSQVDSDA